METRSAASFVNGGRGAFIACAALYGLMIAFLGTALFLRISRVASWANLPSLKATELVVVASSMIALTLSKLIFYSFLLQRAIIVLCLGENARRWCYRCAAGGMVVGLSLIVTLTYLPVLQHHALLESGDCLIGHSTAVDVVAVLIDIPSDVGLTVLFLIPVYSAKFEGSRPVAKRTAIACGLTTVTGVCGYVAFFHNSGYLSFWIYHLLSAIMVFVGGASVFYVMSGVDPMGIQGLLPMLKDIQRPVHVREWHGKTLAVDAYVWLHRGAYGCAEDLAQGKPTVQYVNYSMHRVRMLKHFGVTPFIVFDGGLLPSKMGTEGDRERKRTDALAKGTAFLAEGKKGLARDCFVKAVDVTPEMAYQLIKALRREGVQYIVAPYEADPQLAYLERHGFVDGIITEDSDLLVFGCRNVLFKLDGDGNGTLVSRADFARCHEYDFAGWTDKEFRQMAILSGCDYVESIVGLGLKTAYRLMRKYKTAEKVIQFVRLAGQHKVPLDYPAHFQRAELTFCHQRVFDPASKSLVHLEPLAAGVDASSMPFVGAPMDDSFARGIASGEIDPLSRKPIVDIAPDNLQPSQVPYKAPPFQSSKSKASTSNQPITGTGSILNFFRPSSQVPASAPHKGKGKLISTASYSLPSIAKRSPNPFALAGNLDKAKKENADVGSTPLVARSKFFGGGKSELPAAEQDEFPDDEDMDYEEAAREEEAVEWDDGIDVDAEQCLRELELEQAIPPSPPAPPKHSLREPSIVSSLGGISSPPASPPRKRRRIANDLNPSPSSSSTPSLEDSFDTKPDDLGISSPPPPPPPSSGVLSSPPLLAPKKSAIASSIAIAIKDEKPIVKGKRKARDPSTDPIDVFSEEPQPDNVATPRASAREGRLSGRRFSGIKREKTLVHEARVEEEDEEAEISVDVAKAWRTKWERKVAPSSTPVNTPSLRKPFNKATTTDSPAPLSRRPAGPLKPSPVPLRKPAPAASSKSTSMFKSKPSNPRIPLSPRKINTSFVDRGGGEDDERPSALLLAFRYTGPL
ncbi:hypothetical protein RQP46_009436 [Phenoliferia psychrophenolica]